METQCKSREIVSQPTVEHIEQRAEKLYNTYRDKHPTTPQHSTYSN